MGRHTYADIVQNSVCVGDLSPFQDKNDFYKINAKNGNSWNMIFEASKAGKNKSLYVNVYGKAVDKKGYFVCELTDDEGFTTVSHIFSTTQKQLEELKEFIASKDFDEVNEDAEMTLTPFKSIKKFIGDKNAVLEFINDFADEKMKIKNEEALSQII